jgi:phosphatidylserine/phosphatidylglycerophosphate/cardiolipin synthase-like enzyme
VLRPIHAALLSGEELYREVVLRRMAGARESLWIATANVKAMFVAGTSGEFRPILELFADLARRGVELRLLHAELPSRPFRAAFEARKTLWTGMQLKLCPRVHFKAVIVDGAWIYLGSANLTGAGLGAKGEGKRNFELGFVTEDFDTIDRATALFESVWSGVECAQCRLREICPDPIGPAAPAGRRVKRRAAPEGVELGRSRRLLTASARPPPSRS